MINNKIWILAFVSSTFFAPACTVQTGDDESENGELGSVGSALGESGSVRGLAGLCLDVQWGSTADGTPIHMWPCNGGAAQQWWLNEQSEIRGLGGKCLDVRGAWTAPGTPVQMWPCNGHPAQKWYLHHDGTVAA